MSAIADPWTVSHDYLFVPGGAEVVTGALTHNVIPGAPVHYLAGRKSLADQLGFPAGSRGVLPSAVASERTFRLLTPAYPALLAKAPTIEGHLLASSYAFAHHLKCTGKKVVYCHSPLRQIWSGSDHYLEHGTPVQRFAISRLGSYLRRKDLEAARTASLYVASGPPVAERIRRYYGFSPVAVIAPPIDTSVFQPNFDTQREDFLLWVGRITEPYKRLGLVLQTAEALPDTRFLIAGDGPDRKALEARSPDNVTFLGWTARDDVAVLYRRAAAVLFSSEDDFGIVPVEAMACGAPVIAFRAGGAENTVKEGESGVFFDTPNPVSLKKAISQAVLTKWDNRAIAMNARSYGLDRFVREMRDVLGQLD